MRYLVQVKLDIGWWTALSTPSLKKANNKFDRLLKQSHEVKIKES